LTFEPKHIHGNKYIINYVNYDKSIKIDIFIDQHSGNFPCFDELEYFQYSYGMFGTCGIEDYVDLNDFSGKLKIKIQKPYNSTIKIKMNIKNGKPFGHYPTGAIVISSPSSKTMKYFCDEEGMTPLNEPFLVHDNKVYYHFVKEPLLKCINRIEYPTPKLNYDISRCLKIYWHKENPLYNYYVHHRDVNFVYHKQVKKFYTNLTLFSDDDEVLLKYYEAQLT